MKIKIFKNHDFIRLEEKVNLFIRDVKVISTQLTIIPPTNTSRFAVSILTEPMTVLW